MKNYPLLFLLLFLTACQDFSQEENINALVSPPCDSDCTYSNDVPALPECNCDYRLMIAPVLDEEGYVDLAATLASVADPRNSTIDFNGNRANVSSLGPTAKIQNIKCLKLQNGSIAIDREDQATGLHIYRCKGFAMEQMVVTPLHPEVINWSDPIPSFPIPTCNSASEDSKLEVLLLIQESDCATLEYTSLGNLVTPQRKARGLVITKSHGFHLEHSIIRNIRTCFIGVNGGPGQRSIATGIQLNGNSNNFLLQNNTIERMMAIVAEENNFRYDPDGILIQGSGANGQGGDIDNPLGGRILNNHFINTGKRALKIFTRGVEVRNNTGIFNIYNHPINANGERTVIPPNKDFYPVHAFISIFAGAQVIQNNNFQMSDGVTGRFALTIGQGKVKLCGPCSSLYPLNIQQNVFNNFASCDIGQDALQIAGGLIPCSSLLEGSSGNVPALLAPVIKCNYFNGYPEIYLYKFWKEDGTPCFPESAMAQELNMLSTANSYFNCSVGNTVFCPQLGN